MLQYERSSKVEVLTKRTDDGNVTSQLTIKDARLTNSGNYTCYPTLARSTSVTVNVVLEGEWQIYLLPQDGPLNIPR